MEQLPVPADPKIPTSQQEAQDTVLRYMQQTIDALPEGVSLDGTRYMIGDGTTYCEDEPADRNAPVKLEDWRDMKVPPDTDVKALIAQVGGIWESWGSLRCCSRNSQPLMMGIMRSSRMMHGASACRRRLRASRPFAASTTW